MPGILQRMPGMPVLAFRFRLPPEVADPRRKEEDSRDSCCLFVFFLAKIPLKILSRQRFFWDSQAFLRPLNENFPSISHNFETDFGSLHWRLGTGFSINLFFFFFFFLPSFNNHRRPVTLSSALSSPLFFFVCSRFGSVNRALIQSTSYDSNQADRSADRQNPIQSR